MQILLHFHVSDDHAQVRLEIDPKRFVLVNAVTAEKPEGVPGQDIVEVVGSGIIAGCNPAAG